MSEDHHKSIQSAQPVINQDFKTGQRNGEANKPNRLAQAREIISVRQIQKLAKGDNPVFLAVIQTSETSPE